MSCRSTGSARGAVRPKQIALIQIVETAIRAVEESAAAIRRAEFENRIKSRSARRREPWELVAL